MLILRYVYGNIFLLLKKLILSNNWMLRKKLKQVFRQKYGSISSRPFRKTDQQPTNRPTDRQTELQGSLSSNNINLRICRKAILHVKQYTRYMISIMSSYGSHLRQELSPNAFPKSRNASQVTLATSNERSVTSL